jgi:hypothetical protein
MVKYYTLDKKRYKSSVDMGRLNRIQKLHYIENGGLVPVNLKMPKGSRQAKPKYKCEKWVREGRRAPKA